MRDNSIIPYPLRVGSKVRLKAYWNGTYTVPEQVGEIECIIHYSWGADITVRLLPAYRDDKQDDGLRGLPVDQVKGLEP